MNELSPMDIVIREAGVEPGTPVHRALSGRADVMAMTQATHDAALMPKDPGAITHGERAALAARVARLNGNERLAAHYLALMHAAGAESATAAIANPDNEAEGERLAAIVTYMDLVAVKPRETTAADIDALKAAGITDADIVRLSELNAFLAYQIRLIAGLKLMGGAK